MNFMQGVCIVETIVFCYLKVMVAWPWLVMLTNGEWENGTKLFAIRVWRLLDVLLVFLL